MDKYNVKLTFIQDILGTITKDPLVYEKYIASKAALTDEELAAELETVEKVEEKGWTGFHTLDGNPILLGYVIKGFFKDACGMLRRAKGTRSSKITAHKKIVDGLIFIEPWQIAISLNGGEMGVNERPLRASTAQGDRVALARSDTCPVGSSVEFTVIVIGQITQDVLEEWLDYGKFRGLGQWRNAGWGSFEYEIEKQ